MSDEVLDIALEKRFGDFSLAVEARLPLHGVTAIFGPSGSGKSSLLRLIAGFERPGQGVIRLGNETWADTDQRLFVPPHRRGVGTVFQGGQLLPHLSVQANLAYADKRAHGLSRGYRLEDVVDAFDLAPLLGQKPSTLSGGERQRAALAQAVLTRPRLLLLDEPLSALDQNRKLEILPYLGRLQEQFNLAMIYVSHDMSEIMHIADHILVMENGQSVAFGQTVATLNKHGFETNGQGRSGVILPGQVTGIDQRLQLVEVAVGAAQLRLPLAPAHKIGAPVRLLIKARDVALSVKRPEGLSIQNMLAGEVRHIEAKAQGAIASVTIGIGEAELPVRLTRAAIESLDLKPAMPIFALIKTAALMA